ncbi:hypothetical protein HHK36_009783 [Tetracentron sinense]|uniref:Uncharacterized protein n=1 Tax=Tetracentron sinense TaxID=13715 RepID=A0A834ZGQ9_TETSI|nr:hypothetical protein HHK36_009783 [Tetracentron sinense]
MEDSASSFSLSSLLCCENEACFDQEVDGDMFTNLNSNYSISESDDEYIEMLVERESSSCRSLDDSCSSTIENSLKCARLDAIRWILKVSFTPISLPVLLCSCSCFWILICVLIQMRAFLGLRSQTAYLSVAYFDGFLSRRAIDSEKSWAIQLLSVACLSIAAKMEECRMLALSEFQVEDYNFDSKVIQKMELLVLKTLEWRMGSITPFAYLHYFIAKFCYESRPKDAVSRAAELILAITKEVNLMDCRPSVIAAAAVLAASDQRLTRKTMEFKMNLISSCGPLENGHIFSCYNLMQELEMGKFKIPKLVNSPDISSVYSTSVDVLADSSFISAVSTKRRRLTFKDCDQNCAITNEKELP